eukprot:m.294098 g.294098  ORF g.294098 m.294098 type:complete len:383 (+) comp12922_c0_seq1:521-1669(+)
MANLAELGNGVDDGEKGRSLVKASKTLNFGKNGDKAARVLDAVGAVHQERHRSLLMRRGVLTDNADKAENGKRSLGGALIRGAVGSSSSIGDGRKLGLGARIGAVGCCSSGGCGSGWRCHAGPGPVPSKNRDGVDGRRGALSESKLAEDTAFDVVLGDGARLEALDVKAAVGRRGAASSRPVRRRVEGNQHADALLPDKLPELCTRLAAAVFRDVGAEGPLGEDKARRARLKAHATCIDVLARCQRNQVLVHRQKIVPAVLLAALGLGHTAVAHVVDTPPAAAHELLVLNGQRHCGIAALNHAAHRCQQPLQRLAGPLRRCPHPPLGAAGGVRCSFVLACPRDYAPAGTPPLHAPVRVRALWRWPDAAVVGSLLRLGAGLWP